MGNTIEKRGDNMIVNNHTEKKLLDAGIDTLVDYKRGLYSVKDASKQLAAQTGLDIEAARDILESMSKHNVVPFPGKKN